MSDLYNILEICLNELEHGADLEKLLSSYPEYASELRPILKASIAARQMASLPPSSESMRRGRAKVMQRAAELKEQKIAPRRMRVIPGFQRFAITFALTTLFLLSGTSLVRASSTALPGENLYTVKRTWEDLRLLFTFDDNQREELEHEFESERLHEVNELIAEGRHETIQFAGIYMDVNGQIFISGVPVVISDTALLPPEGVSNGLPVVVTGHTDANGFVVIDSIELLPAGTKVPEGAPVEVENEGAEDSEQNQNDSSGTGSGSEDDANENSSPEESSAKMEGTVETFADNKIVINGQVVYLDQNVEIKGQLRPGVLVKVEGYYNADGNFIVRKIEVLKFDDSSDANLNSNDDSNDNGSGDDDGNNSGGSNDNDDSSNDDNDDDD